VRGETQSGSGTQKPGNDDKMKFNSNKERKTYWEMLIEKYNSDEIEKAIAALKPDTARVICLHYRQHYSLKEITTIMNRSITVIRNHHNRGIYKLYRYFNPNVSDNT
jgi:DNA-directed RNA polymerase specialized sigma24 family protein